MGHHQEHNSCIMGVPGGEEERKKGAESLFKEIISKNFPNLERDTDIQIHGAHRSPNRFNPKKPSPRNI